MYHTTMLMCYYVMNVFINYIFLAIIYLFSHSLTHTIHQLINRVIHRYDIYNSSFNLNRKRTSN